MNISPDSGNVKSDGRTVEFQFLGDFSDAQLLIAHSAILRFSRSGQPVESSVFFDSIISADDMSLIIWYRTALPQVVLETDTDLAVSGIPEEAFGNEGTKTAAVEDFSVDNFSGLSEIPIQGRRRTIYMSGNLRAKDQRYQLSAREACETIEDA